MFIALNKFSHKMCYIYYLYLPFTKVYLHTKQNLVDTLMQGSAYNLILVFVRNIRLDNEISSRPFVLISRYYLLHQHLVALQNFDGIFFILNN